MLFFVSDAFVEHYSGGAELTTEAIIQSSNYPINKLTSEQVNPTILERYKDSYWIFGNFSGLSTKSIIYAIKNLNYSIIEYDYKFCKFRSIKKHINFEGECDCHTSSTGKLIATFLAKSDKNFWMSAKQLDLHQERFPFLNKNNVVLNSVFSEKTLANLKKFKTSEKNNKWIILNSPSWIKGAQDAVDYAKNNNLEYELVWGLEYNDLLQKLSESKGLIFLPKAGDTCPRLVMEAKILGCELILNDDVQHKDEEWFENYETIMTHLETRCKVFWDNLESVASSTLKFRAIEEPESVNFKVIVPFYNVQDWIDKCIKSLKSQRYRKFQCYLIDDMSTDNSAKIISKAIDGDPRFTLISNETKQYALGNISKTLDNIHCDDSDVIILLDGDDWLASTHSMSILANTYRTSECLMTYGSYVYNPGGVVGVEPSEYPLHVIESNAYRQDMWRASHLRSFRYDLWTKIKQEDLQDENGEYYKMTYDQAIMLPLLEMAGHKSRFISDILYVYNKENPLNVDKIKAEKQYALAQKIRGMTPYGRL